MIQNIMRTKEAFLKTEETFIFHSYPNYFYQLILPNFFVQVGCFTPGVGIINNRFGDYRRFPNLLFLEPGANQGRERADQGDPGNIQKRFQPVR